MKDWSSFKKGLKFGTLKIIEEPKSYDGRYLIIAECKCGRKLPIRPARWGSTYSCRLCMNSTHYPEIRKSTELHYNGLRIMFLNKLRLSDNLNRGKNRKLIVDITIQQLYEKLVEQDFKCALSGIPLEVLHLHPTTSNASIDRIDSNGNYTIDNIQWVHKDVNRMKNYFPQERFVEICNLVTKYKYDNFEPSQSGMIERCND
jgi:hypothetical protein